MAPQAPGPAGVKASDTGKPTEVPALVSAVAGALTAAAAFVVLPGGLVLVARLAEAHLPTSLTIVTSLPHQLLLATGLSYILFPLVVASAVTLLVLWLPGSHDQPNPALMTERADRPRRLLAKRVPSGILGIWRGLRTRKRVGRGWLWSFVVLAFVANLGAGIFAFRLWREEWWWWAIDVLAGLALVVGLLLSERDLLRDEPKFKRPGTIALGALWASLFFLPAAFVVAANRPLLATTVCLEGGQRVDGVLVGQASDRIYVGEAEHRVAVFVSPAKARRAIDIQGTMHNLNYDVRGESSPLQIGLQRLDLVVGWMETVQREALARVPRPEDNEEVDRSDLRALFPPLASDDYAIDGDELARLALEQVPVLVFSRDPETADRASEYGQIQGVSPSEIENRDAFSALVRSITEADYERDQPDRRIISVPSSRVTQMEIGGLGSCPVPVAS